MPSTRSRVWIVIAVITVVALIGGGAGFWFSREASIRDEIAHATAKADRAKLSSGEELTAAIAALEAVRTKYAGRAADDLRDADSAARTLAERQRELTDRKTDFDELLSTAERLTLTDPGKALRKLAEAAEKGKEDSARGYQSLLLSVSPPIEERRDEASACYALAKAKADASLAADEGNWARVRDLLSTALDGHLPPGARRSEAEELLSTARSRIERSGNKLLEGEKCLAVNKFVEAKVAFEEATLLWPKSPDTAKAVKGIEAAHLGEGRRLEEVRKADLRQALTTALQLAVDARNKGDWQNVARLLKRPLSDLGSLDHPQRDVARSYLEQAEAELKKRNDYQEKLREGKSLLAAQRYVEAKNALETAKKIWPDAPTVAEADEGIRQAYSKSNDLRYEEWMTKARRAIAEKRWTEAEELLTKALQEKPQNPEASQTLKQVQKQLSDHRYAAAIALGQELFQQKRWPEARAAFEKARLERFWEPVPLDALAALDQAEKDTAIEQLLTQGFTLRQQEKWMEARDVYRQALKENNSCKAAADALAAIDIEEKSYWLRWEQSTLAEVKSLYNKGLDAETIALAESLYQETQQPSLKQTALFHKGGALLRSGDKVAGIRCLLAAYDLDTTSEIARGIAPNVAVFQKFLSDMQQQNEGMLAPQEPPPAASSALRLVFQQLRVEYDFVVNCVFRGPKVLGQNSIAVILVHGNGSDDIRHFNSHNRWQVLVDLVKLNSEAFADFEFYNWRHDTSQPVGFNGHTGNAAALAEWMKTFFHPSEKVVLLAHSRGGLVCRAFMNHEKQGDRVLKLITLGTPHHGSPLAVPDWLAQTWYKSKMPLTVSVLFDTICDKGSKIFDLSRIGTLNLAWDNQDRAITSSVSFRYPIKIAENGSMMLTPGDMNTREDGVEDMTEFYRKKHKEDFGTLAELNRIEKYHKKITAFACYDSDLGDNCGLGSVAWDKYFTGEELQWRDGPRIKHIEYKYERSALDAFTRLMSEFADGRYAANDGLVPVQSALFLDIAAKPLFFSRQGQQIILDRAEIERAQQVSRHHIFPGDHLTLLTGHAEQHARDYFEALLHEIADCRSKQ